MYDNMNMNPNTNSYQSMNPNANTYQSMNSNVNSYQSMNGIQFFYFFNAIFSNHKKKTKKHKWFLYNKKPNTIEMYFGFF